MPPADIWHSKSLLSSSIEVKLIGSDYTRRNHVRHLHNLTHTQTHTQMSFIDHHDVSLSELRTSSLPAAQTHWISLDFIMEVIEPCDVVEDPECNMPPYFVPDDPPVVNFYRGIEGSFEITAKDDNPDDVVTVTNTVLPKGATFNEVRVGNPSVYRLRWTPDLDDNPAVVCFQARDSRDPVGSCGCVF